MQISLDQLRIGREAVVIGVETAEEYRRRLRDFGLVPGTKVRCYYRGPGGHVTAIWVRGTVVALRTKDLRRIRVCC